MFIRTISRQKLLRNLALLLLFLLLLGGGRTFAQGALNIRAWTVDGGGGAMQGATYTLRGTASQYDSGALTGAQYRLYGGFWGPATTTSSSQLGIYLPSISNE